MWVNILMDTRLARICLDWWGNDHFLCLLCDLLWHSILSILARQGCAHITLYAITVYFLWELYRLPSQFTSFLGWAYRVAVGVPYSKQADGL